MEQTIPEKMELDESTKQKLDEMLRNPDIEADILWIEVSSVVAQPSQLQFTYFLIFLESHKESNW